MVRRRPETVVPFCSQNAGPCPLPSLAAAGTQQPRKRAVLSHAVKPTDWRRAPFQLLNPPQVGRLSRIALDPPVDTTRASVKPPRRSSARYSASDRSHPPSPMNHTSKNLFGSGSFGGLETPSTSNSRPSSRIALRQL